MPEKIYSGDGVPLFTTYPAVTVAGGTDVTADLAGVTWGPIYVGPFSELAVDVVVVFIGGASPGVTINLDRYLGDDKTVGSNVSTNVQSGNGTTTFHIGGGQATNKSFARFIRVTWTAITGAPTSISIQVSIIGKS